MNIETIYISGAVQKQLLCLEKSGKKGALALLQYQQLLERFVSGEFFSNEVLSKRTKHGEMRIKNCCKYDLGAGFRLVTVMQEQAVFLVLIGSHDNVDLWLENNVGYIPMIRNNEYKTSITVQPKGDTLEEIAEQEQEYVDQYEQLLQEKIDDSVLRHVFSSFFASQKA